MKKACQYFENINLRRKRHLVFTGNLAPSLSHDLPLLVGEIVHVQPLVLIELLHGLTERDGLRTPDVPGRTTTHPPRLAGLHALQEVVVLLLLAGLLRPVEEVVLDDGDLAEFVVASLHVLSCLVLQPDPRKDAEFCENVVKLGIVDYNAIVEAGIQVEQGAMEGCRCQLVGLNFAWK